MMMTMKIPPLAHHWSVLEGRSPNFSSAVRAAEQESVACW